MPAGGSIGYEIYDKPEGFGTTSFVQGVNHLRATEGELARTVATLGPVQQARVHLVLPKREMFSRTQQTATASVFLKLRPGQQLKREQVVAIQHLIAAAVPQLEPNQISIIDDRGNLLARGLGNGGDANSQANADEKKLAYEQRTTRVIEDLLSRSLGFGKVRAEVTADLDFDRITTNSEIYDPESQVIRSTQTVEDNNESTDRDALDPVTVANQLPTGDANQSASGATSKTKGARTEETINYEISKTVKSHVRESGQVRRLSVAVLVDGIVYAGPGRRPRIRAPLQGGDGPDRGAGALGHRLRRRARRYGRSDQHALRDTGRGIRRRVRGRSSSAWPRRTCSGSPRWWCSPSSPSS